MSFLRINLGITFKRGFFILPFFFLFFLLSSLPTQASPSYYYISRKKFVLNVEKGALANSPFDEKGIPVVEYPRRGNPNSKRYYNPSAVAQYGLGAYELYLDGDGRYFPIFIKQADWLVSNQRNGLWRHSNAVQSHSLRPGWISAMTQGLGISLLTRAYIATSDEKYLKVAKMAVAPFWKDVRNGGVASYDYGGIWFEEYPTNPPSHVLNGFIFALFGLYDYCLVTQDLKAYKLLNQAVITLSKNLHRYEKNGKVLYQLKGEVVKDNYDNLIFEQLHALTQITLRGEFGQAALQWERAKSRRQLSLPHNSISHKSFLKKSSTKKIFMVDEDNKMSKWWKSLQFMVAEILGVTS